MHEHVGILSFQETHRPLLPIRHLYMVDKYSDRGAWQRALDMLY